MTDQRRRMGRDWTVAIALAAAVVLGTSGPVAAVEGWQGPTTISSFGRENVALVWDTARARPHIAFPDGTSHGIFYMTRTSSGWIRQRVSSGHDHWARIAIDPDGYAHVVFYRADEDCGCVPIPSRGVYYATNRTGHWVVQRLTHNTGDFDPSIVYAGGALHVVVGRNGVGIMHLTGTNGVWTKEVASVEPTLDYVSAPARPALTSDANGDLYVAYAAPGPDPLANPYAGIRYLTTRDTPGWIRQTVSTAPDYNTNIAIGSNGVPHIVFVRDDHHYQRIGVVYATIVGGMWKKEIMAPGGGFPYVTVDLIGQPYVAFADEFGVVIARKSGGSWGYAVLSDDYGYSPDVKFAGNGTLRIAYAINGIHWLRELP